MLVKSNIHKQHATFELCIFACAHATKL